MRDVICMVITSSPIRPNVWPSARWPKQVARLPVAIAGWSWRGPRALPSDLAAAHVGRMHRIDERAFTCIGG